MQLLEGLVHAAQTEQICVQDWRKQEGIVAGRSVIFDAEVLAERDDSSNCTFYRDWDSFDRGCTRKGPRFRACKFGKRRHDLFPADELDYELPNSISLSTLSPFLINSKFLSSIIHDTLECLDIVGTVAMQFFILYLPYLSIRPNPLMQWYRWSVGK